MAARSHSQSVSPLLGMYFGIFVASLVAIVIMLLILEQLGMSERRLRACMMLGSVGLYAAIGAAAFTQAPIEYFFSGRRVPSFFVGLSVAVTALGGTGLVAFAGAIFLAGFDALCVPLGIIGGLVAGVLLIAPFLRKFGAPTVPGYLGIRFNSRAARLVGATAAAAPLILLLIAELKIAMLAASWLVELPAAIMMSLLIATLVGTLAPGGARSLAWSGAAKSMACLLALLIPATIIAIMETNLPLGQISHGPVLRALVRIEIAQNIPAVIASPLAFELPGTEMQAISGRFALPFGSVGPAAFVLAALVAMLGIAAHPGLLGRTATTPSVYETRKSIGWAVFVGGVVIMTLSALSVFYRNLLMSQIAGAAGAAVPLGLRALVKLGLADLDLQAAKLAATSVSFRRDGVLLGLPVLMGFPTSLVYLVAAGVLAAALAGAAASLAQLGLILAEDVVGEAVGVAGSDSRRLLLPRVAIVATAVAAGAAAVVFRSDPLELFLWSLTLSGASLFPVLFLSIWWKRINAWGATAGLASGFLVTAIAIVLGRAGGIGLPSELAAVIGAPVGFIAAIAASLATQPPGKHVLELVRDLRIPGGETIYDREGRIARQKRIARM